MEMGVPKRLKMFIKKNFQQIDVKEETKVGLRILKSKAEVKLRQKLQLEKLLTERSRKGTVSEIGGNANKAAKIIISLPK